jgi:hypothetical protein
MSYGNLFAKMAGQRWAILAATLVGMTATLFPWAKVDASVFVWTVRVSRDGGDAGLWSFFLFAGILTCALLGKVKRHSLSGFPFWGVLALSALATLNALGAIRSDRDTVNKAGDAGRVLEWVYGTGTGAYLALFAGTITFIFAVVLGGGRTQGPKRGDRPPFWKRPAWKRFVRKWKRKPKRSSR